MSEKVLDDLKSFVSNKPAVKVQHPLYDNFGAPVSKEQARAKLGLPERARIILFFGFIRKYKGLDILLEAMSILQKSSDVKLLVAGEFYEDEQPYRDIIHRYSLDESLMMHTHFIPDADVKYYLCAADAVIQPYRNATQSGVTPLAYHFEKPMIVTNVGGLPALVPDNKAGLITAPEPQAIANAVMRYFELGENYFIPHLRSEKEKYSWSKMTEAILKLADDIQK
jgi:glycosyltransferase involved in cell wall biosynthesis